MSRIDSFDPPQANPDVGRPRRGGPDGPVAFVRDSLRMAWRWLTRMRTALYLLAALGAMTLLATIVPQEPNVPQTVRDWRSGEAGPGTTVSQFIDLLGGYDVYGSAAFLALLLLLFISLTACLIPRYRAWWRLVRRSRPPLIRNLSGQPTSASFATDRSPAEVEAAARDLLAARRWRLREPVEAPSSNGAPVQVAAEKGIVSREGGSLLFHTSFYVLLLAIVLGQLTGFTGQVGVVEGGGFADTAVSYWSYDPGRWWGEDSHRGWVMDLDEFEVDWIRDPQAPGAGQATTFLSNVTFTHPDGRVEQRAISGNRPARVDGMQVLQLDWGYAPRIQVEVDGEIVFDNFIIATVTDAGFFRSAVKAPAADPDVGLDVFLYPYAPPGDDGLPVFTGAPWADAPLLVYHQYRGDLQLGRTQQMVNELDISALESVGGGALRVGGQVTMDDGVIVRFTDLRRWVGFAISERPQLPWLVLASTLLMAGLVAALYAYRRRLWVVAVRDEPAARTLVTVAGRAFQRPQTFEEEHERLVRLLSDQLGGRDPATPDEPAPSSQPTEVRR